MKLFKFLAILFIIGHSSRTIAAQKWECVSEQYNYAPNKLDWFCVFRSVEWKKKAPEPEFASNTATKVAFFDSTFSRLPESFFQAFSQLEWLVVKNSSLEDLTITNRMKNVQAEGNQIKSMQIQGAGAGMKLTTLSLRDNPISDITTIVQHLSGLEMLDLSSTEVTIDKDNTIELSSFAPLINLTELYLSRVEAYYLENEAEAKLPALKILDVSGNPFTTSDFNLRVFRTLPNLEELSLRDAVMDHLSVTDIRQDLPALKRIYLDGNNFNCTVLQILLAHFKEKGLEAPGQSSKCHPGYDNVQGLCCKSYGDYIPPVRPQGSSTLDPTKDGLGTTTRSPAVSTPIDTPSIPPSKTKSENEENGSNQLTLIIICTVIGLLVVLGIALLVYKQVMKRHQPVPTSDNLMPDL